MYQSYPGFRNFRKFTYDHAKVIEPFSGMPLSGRPLTARHQYLTWRVAPWHSDHVARDEKHASRTRGINNAAARSPMSSPIASESHVNSFLRVKFTIKVASLLSIQSRQPF